MTTRDNQLSNITRQLAEIEKQLDSLLAGYRCECDGECLICGGLVRLAMDADQMATVCRSELNADVTRWEMDAA